MSIVSFEFLLLIIFVILIYYLFPRKNQWIILLIFSLLFYISNSSLIYVLISSLSVYIFSLIITASKNLFLKKLWLFLGIFINVFLLVVLKYDLFSYIDSAFSLIMPLGISYYTLCAISYLIDVYKRKISVEGYFKLLLSLSFFPTLIQGPIVKYRDLKKTIFDIHTFKIHNFVWGSLRILWGFFKKLVIVSRLSLITSYVVSNELSGIFVVIGLLLYGIQIYSDFSSGIDIVIGFAKILQVELEENFNVPYLSKSLNEFWKRWHISLTNWYREYVYFSLGGNKCSKLRNIINIMIVFIVSGMWHGPTINFFLWGLCNGIILVVEKLFKYSPNKKIFIFINYGIVSLLWIFFLYSDFSSVIAGFISVLNISNYNLLSINYLDIMSVSNYIILGISVLFLIFIDCLKYKGKEFIFKYRNRDYILVIVLIFVVILLGIYGIGFDQNEFIYNNF